MGKPALRERRSKASAACIAVLAIAVVTTVLTAEADGQSRDVDLRVPAVLDPCTARAESGERTDVVLSWGNDLLAERLTPEKPILVRVALDRCGERATSDSREFSPTSSRVFAVDARLTIRRISPSRTLVYDGPMSAGIDSLGGVVHEFRWGAGGPGIRIQPGSYVISFTAPRAGILGDVAVDGTSDLATSTSSSVTVTVTSPWGKPSSRDEGHGTPTDGGQDHTPSVVIIGRG